MSTDNRNSEDKEKTSDMEAWSDWSDHLMVAAFFIFLVLLGFIVR